MKPSAEKCKFHDTASRCQVLKASVCTCVTLFIAGDLGDLIGDGFDDLGDAIGDGLDDIGDFIGDGIDTIGDGLDDIGDAIGDGIDDIGDALGGLFGRS